MNRRDWLKLAGASGAASALPVSSFAPFSTSRNAQPAPATNVNVALKRLNLQHTWTTTMSSSTYRETVNVRYLRDRLTGYGEGAPIIRYKEFPAEAKQAIDANLDHIISGDPVSFAPFLGIFASASVTISAPPWPPSISP